ncbi:MAG: MFS transporter [Chloroflexota bacterium]
MTRSTLRWLYASEGVSLGLLLPFLVPLLDERGLQAAQIGLVLGASGTVSLLAYPLWGVLADRWLGRRTSIAVVGLTATLGGLWIVFADSDPVTLTLAISLALAGALPLGPLTDALALGTLGDDPTDYGRPRAWASLGWAASAIAAGLLWTAFDSTPVLVAFSISALLISALVLASTRQDRSARAAAAATAGDRKGRVRGTPSPGLRSWLPLLASPVLLGFLAGLLLVSIGEHATWRYVGLRILDQGGGIFLVGLAAALPALVEIPVFTNSRRLASRLGLRMIFVSGALIAAVLSVLIAVASEAWMVTLLRSLDGTSFALRHMGMVLIIGVLLPRSLHAVGQSMGWLMLAGIAPIIADLAGGFIYADFGGTVLFLLAAVLMVAGGAIVYVVLAGAAFDRDAAAEAPSRKLTS